MGIYGREKEREGKRGGKGERERERESRRGTRFGQNGWIEKEELKRIKDPHINKSGKQKNNFGINK